MQSIRAQGQTEQQNIPGIGTDVIVLHNAQQTFVAPLG